MHKPRWRLGRSCWDATRWGRQGARLRGGLAGVAFKTINSNCACLALEDSDLHLATCASGHGHRMLHAAKLRHTSELS